MAETVHLLNERIRNDINSSVESVVPCANLITALCAIEVSRSVAVPWPARCPLVCRADQENRRHASAIAPRPRLTAMDFWPS